MMGNWWTARLYTRLFQPCVVVQGLLVVTIGCKSISYVPSFSLVVTVLLLKKSATTVNYTIQKCTYMLGNSTQHAAKMGGKKYDSKPFLGKAGWIHDRWWWKERKMQKIIFIIPIFPIVKSSHNKVFYINFSWHTRLSIGNHLGPWGALEGPSNPETTKTCLKSSVNPLSCLNNFRLIQSIQAIVSIVAQVLFGQWFPVLHWWNSTITLL